MPPAFSALSLSVLGVLSLPFGRLAPDGGVAKFGLMMPGTIPGIIIPGTMPGIMPMGEPMGKFKNCIFKPFMFGYGSCSGYNICCILLLALRFLWP